MAMGVSTSLDTNGHGGGSNSLSRPATQGFALARQPCYRLRTMASTTDDLPPSEPVPGMIDTPFDSALSERYLVYALLTITARSLPDLRDGLKPVHRRLLWAMREMRLDPSQGYKQSERVVGGGRSEEHTAGLQSLMRLSEGCICL